VHEIPKEFIEEVRLRQGAVTQVASQAMSTGSGSGFCLGQQVRHEKFGEGVVMNCEGSGAHARVQVNFDAVGSKWLVVSYANLQTV
jgi:DNA helicase-2/ATP-dependent DNA helicase PcrA